MRKLILVAAVVFSLVSCEEETSSNNPSFETTIGYTFWRAESWSASVTNGTLVVYGRDLTEQVMITIPNYELGKSYELGQNNSLKVEYMKVNDDDSVTTLSTGAGIGSGYVRLESPEFGTPNTITGRFMAEVKGTGNVSQTLHNGIFYRIPISQPVVTE